MPSCHHAIVPSRHRARMVLATGVVASDRVATGCLVLRVSRRHPRRRPPAALHELRDAGAMGGEVLAHPDTRTVPGDSRRIDAGALGHPLEAALNKSLVRAIANAFTVADAPENGALRDPRLTGSV